MSSPTVSSIGILSTGGGGGDVKSLNSPFFCWSSLASFEHLIDPFPQVIARPAVQWKATETFDSDTFTSFLKNLIYSNFKFLHLA
ncbi:hypothetical protein NL676_026387 [Syzygium grande]|nr:hypothetical protein NL676_026387 [Syzygium grande]